MIEHDGCKGCKYEDETPHSQHCQYCTQNAVDKYTRKTNADKIRNMTDKELAEVLFEYSNCDYCCIREKCTKIAENSCIDTFLAWLQSEVEE